MLLTPPQLTTDDPIPVHVAGDKAYVYNVDSIRRLRVDHHITGITLGTLPQVAQQNVFLGVPLQLLPEEVAVLVEERELLHELFLPNRPCLQVILTILHVLTFACEQA
jgi:hypothetical protein